LPSDFHFSFRAADIWVPWSFSAEDRGNRRSHYLRVLARLKPQGTIESAQAEMNASATRLADEYPEWMKGWGVAVHSFHDEIVGGIRTSLLVLFGAVGVVLLIGCANVASLLLAKATAREKEMAVRLPMGAGRGRLVRQLMRESLLLSAMGGALGAILAFWSLRSLVTWIPFTVPVPA
jgi:predicted lysophospholipase L1 biosynthesis ABC-type transport system permease subunit